MTDAEFLENAKRHVTNEARTYDENRKRYTVTLTLINGEEVSAGSRNGYDMARGRVLKSVMYGLDKTLPVERFGLPLVYERDGIGTLMEQSLARA